MLAKQSEQQQGAQTSPGATELPGAIPTAAATTTGQDVERFFLDYIKQKQIAEGDLPDPEEEGQCWAWERC